MITLREQLVDIINGSKILQEGLEENEDITLGTIEKYLNEAVSEKCSKVLGDAIACKK